MRRNSLKFFPHDRAHQLDVLRLPLLRLETNGCHERSRDGENLFYTFENCLDWLQEFLSRHGLHFEIDDINRIWKEHLSTDRIPGVLQPEWPSIFLKLQGLGLATTVERIATQLPPNEQPFALLPKGADFVRYIQGTVVVDSTVNAA